MITRRLTKVNKSVDHFEAPRPLEWNAKPRAKLESERLPAFSPYGTLRRAMNHFAHQFVDRLPHVVVWLGIIAVAAIVLATLISIVIPKRR